ncbi:hypothetical protein [Luteolibacter soli]|uniref:Uncharacterized protein n=1 Tax=Luteolibacter soli TaxID=3135280 RepID=A0ABU9AVM3_9BACT
MHRSRLFLLGLPALIFLTWIWLGTRPFLGWAQYGTPPFLILAGTDTGTYRLALTRPLSSNIHFAITGLRRDTSWNEPPAPLFPQAIAWQSEQTHIRHSTELRLAHWFVLALYLPAWLTTTALWHRRKRHLLDTGSATPP